MGDKIQCPSCELHWYAERLPAHLEKCKGKLIEVGFGSEDDALVARRRARRDGLRFKSGERWCRIDGEKAVVSCWTIRRPPVRVRE